MLLRQSLFDSWYENSRGPIGSTATPVMCSPASSPVSVGTGAVVRAQPRLTQKSQPWFQPYLRKEGMTGPSKRTPPPQSHRTKASSVRLEPEYSGCGAERSVSTLYTVQNLISLREGTAIHVETSKLRVLADQVMLVQLPSGVNPLANR